MLNAQTAEIDKRKSRFEQTEGLLRNRSADWKQVVSKAAKLLADEEALREVIQAAGEIEIDVEQSKFSLKDSVFGTAHSGV